MPQNLQQEINISVEATTEVVKLVLMFGYKFYADLCQRNSYKTYLKWQYFLYENVVKSIGKD